MTFEKWDIWLARVKFDESDDEKIRPVLVADEHNAVVIALKMTSHAPRPNYPNEYAIADWKGAGLTVPTTIRGGKLLRISPSAFIKKLGQLQSIDIVNVGQF